jgi:hypothetical protein
MLSQTWQTVDDFQYASGQDSEVDSLAVAPNGALFACGDATDASGIYHELVMASADGGITWSGPLDDFVPAGDNLWWYAAGIVADRAGNLYVAGNTESSGIGASHWMVRRSSDGGANWSTVDDYQDGGVFTSAHGITADAAGNVYVVGYLDGTSSWAVRKGTGGTNFSTIDIVSSSWLEGADSVFVHPTAGVFAPGVGPVATTTDKRGHVTITYGWVVRRSTNGGTTWSTVDNFSLAAGNKSVASGIASDALGNIYVVGYGYTSTGKGATQTTSRHWLVRKSTDGGNSWTTVDNYQLASGIDSSATAFAADAQGNLFVAGYGGAANNQHWIVRKNPGGSGSWSTSDDFLYGSIYGAQSLAITANSSGNVFVGGLGFSSSGTHWLVRKH